MASYSSIFKPITWTLLFMTILYSVVALIAILAGFGMAVLMKTMVSDGKPMNSADLYWLPALILLPSVFLSRYYLLLLKGKLSHRIAAWGWLASAAFHAVWAFNLFGSPASISVRGMIRENISIQAPMALISMAAAGVSVWLFINYPRPPRLPNS